MHFDCICGLLIGLDPSRSTAVRIFGAEVSPPWVGQSALALVRPEFWASSLALARQTSSRRRWTGYSLAVARRDFGTSEVNLGGLGWFGSLTLWHGTNVEH